MTYSAPFAFAAKSLTYDPYAPVVARTTRRQRRRRLRARTVAGS